MQRIVVFVVVVFMLAACSPNNVTIDNSLEKYFKQNNVTGTFALMNNADGKFTIYNLKRYRDSAYTPASTFKIVNSLFGLQSGAITNDSMIIKWDGIVREEKEWNKDLTMYEAFRVSSVPYYQEVARRIGKEKMQHFLDTLGYGNKKISRIDTFWLDNSLKVKPDEQLGLVKRLYFTQLPFFKNYQETVKRAMLFEDNANYKLSYKTGWGKDEKGQSIGWIEGWIEENNHPYFFVLNFTDADPNTDLRTKRINLLKDILKQLGFLEGKM